jgi:hypothetical protein
MSTESETWAVDRFEAQVAVLVSDSGDVLEVARSLLPPGSRVGAVLRIARRADGDIAWGATVVDEEAIRQRLAESEGVLEELRRRDPGGDIAL